MAPATARILILVSSSWFFLPLCFLLHHLGAVTPPPVSFSFDFSNTSRYRLEDLRFEGNAALSQDLVDLTCNSDTVLCLGRMSYNHPVPFYDDSTGDVTSFVTTFTFAMNLDPNESTHGNGMTFFLSGYPSTLPPASRTSLLGLTNISKTIPSGMDRFLAVEFSTYGGGGDNPPKSNDHMGIDLNSITSVSTTRLPTYSLNGTMTATITFDSTTMTLEATLHIGVPATVKTQLADSDQLNALLPHVVAVGFSATSGKVGGLHQIHSWSFNSSSTTLATGATKVHPEQGQVLGAEGRHGQALIIGGAVLLALAMVLVIWSTLSWYRWKRTRDSFGKGSRLRRFEYRDLSIATNRFSDMKKIGEGGFGVVYIGNLKEGQVAVKRIMKDSRGEFKDFLAELGAIGRTGHVNVVRLEGWCCSINNFLFWCLHRQNVKLFLVYELVPNGNLHQHLHKRTDILSWASRYKIVKGLWSALYYLHFQCDPYILHRDIKPSNILLDNEFNAKLGDFGLSRVAQDSLETSLRTTRAFGTALYMDPLCMKDGYVNFRRTSDMYSFGIVLLEIAHGECAPDFVRKLQTDRPGTLVDDVADKKLAGQFDRKEMERVIVLGLGCCDQIETNRPSLTSAMDFLENGGELCPATATPTRENDPHAAPA